MSDFWKLSSMSSDVPKGYPLLTTVYPRGHTDLRTDQAGLFCVHGLEDGTQDYFYDPRNVRELTAHLHGQGVTEAALEFEPWSQGDRKGYTPRNRAWAEQIVSDFHSAGIRVQVVPLSLEPGVLEWQAGIAGKLYFQCYPMSTSPAFWWTRRLEELSATRKRFRLAVEAWVSPRWVGGGSGDGNPIPKLGEPVGGILWDQTVKFAQDYCDGAVEWVSMFNPATSGFDPFDYKAPWLGVFGGGR